MAFPVDILGNCSHQELESSAEYYLSDLRCGDPQNPEIFSPPGKVDIPISLSMVGFVPLYGGDQMHKILALFAPEDTLTAVAFYLADQWWAIEDIVRTSSPQREGLRQVVTLGDRVVLYILNRIIYRKQEMTKSEVPFLCHGSADYAKILWKNGEAIGFYSVKPSGSLCNSYLTLRYQLPVLDTMFVRKRHREKDFGLQMLEDFVDCFSEDALGLRYPLASSTYAACKQYLEKYPGDQDLLWEVEGVGHWFQRTRIASKIQKEALKTIGASPCENTMSVTENDSLKSSSEHKSGSEQRTDTQDKAGAAQLAVDSCEDLDATEAQASTSEDYDITPVSTRTRSSHLKRPRIGRRLQESAEVNPPEEEDSIALTSSVRSKPIANISPNTKEFLENRTEEATEEMSVDILGEPTPPTSHEETEELYNSASEKLEDEGKTEQESWNSEITEEALAIEMEIDNAVCSGELSVEPESPDEDISPVLVPVIAEPFTTSTDIASEQKTEQESRNSEITEEALAIEKEIDNAVCNGELSVEPESPDEEISTVLVPVIVEPFTTSTDIASDQKHEQESLSSEITEEALVIETETDNSVSDGELSFVPEHADEHLYTVLFPLIIQPVETSMDTSSDQENEQESHNTEITEETLAVRKETSNAVSDGELSFEPESPDEENVTVPVPSIVQSLKTSEDTPSDQAHSPAEMEVSSEDHRGAEKDESEAKEAEASEEKTSRGSTDVAAAMPNEELTNNGLPNSVDGETLKERAVPVPENTPPDVVPLLEEKHHVAVQGPLEAAEVLRQSSLVVVELRDVAFQHHTDGHKSQSEEQSEESAVEKVAESSSEEAEAETPIRERRGLRRKTRGFRGGPRKRGKLSA